MTDLGIVSLFSPFREYFSNLEKHRKSFVWTEDKSCETCIDLAFNKTRADDRKDWLNRFEEGTFLNTKESEVLFLIFFFPVCFYIADSLSRLC
jgi:DNA topoisomerase-2